MAKMSKKEYLKRRHWRIRKKVIGTAETPRMCVKKTNKHIYVQFIDDDKGHTLAAASTVEKEFSGSNVTTAEELGRVAAERGKSAGIERVVFDRSGFRYHGKIQAIADAARKAGLQF